MFYTSVRFRSVDSYVLNSTVSQYSIYSTCIANTKVSTKYIIKNKEYFQASLYYIVCKDTTIC